MYQNICDLPPQLPLPRPHLLLLHQPPRPSINRRALISSLHQLPRQTRSSSVSQTDRASLLHL